MSERKKPCFIFYLQGDRKDIFQQLWAYLSNILHIVIGITSDSP